MCFVCFKSLIKKILINQVWMGWELPNNKPKKGTNSDCTRYFYLFLLWYWAIIIELIFTVFSKYITVSLHWIKLKFSINTVLTWVLLFIVKRMSYKLDIARFLWAALHRSKIVRQKRQSVSWGKDMGMWERNLLPVVFILLHDVFI